MVSLEYLIWRFCEQWNQLCVRLPLRVVSKRLSHLSKRNI